MRTCSASSGSVMPVPATGSTLCTWQPGRRASGRALAAVTLVVSVLLRSCSRLQASCFDADSAAAASAASMSVSARSTGSRRSVSLRLRRLSRFRRAVSCRRCAAARLVSDSPRERSAALAASAARVRAACRDAGSAASAVAAGEGTLLHGFRMGIPLAVGFSQFGLGVVDSETQGVFRELAVQRFFERVDGAAGGGQGQLGG